MQRRVQQPDGDGQPLHGGEHTLEVGLLHGQDLLEGRRPLLRGFRQDHLPHGGQAVSGHEHVLRAAESDALCPQLTRLGGVVEGVGVSGFTKGDDVHCRAQHHDSDSVGALSGSGKQSPVLIFGFDG